MTILIFVSTLNKDIIRSKFDKVVVEDEWRRKGRSLTYFGLPGPEMLDVLEWRKYLGTIIAVEREMYARHFLRTKVFKEGYGADRFQILAGDIDDVILEGKDLDGKKPMEPVFDLINLDYYGGLVYKDLKGKSKRVKALKKLFEIQSKEERDFLLLLTINTRNRDYEEFDRTLDIIQGELEDYGVDASGVIDWYKEARYDFKIKVYLPYVLGCWSIRDCFVCEDIHVVTYQGSSGRRMVHFATVFHYDEKIVGRAKSGSLVDMLNLPMHEAVNGKLRECEIQAPQLYIEPLG